MNGRQYRVSDCRTRPTIAAAYETDPRSGGSRARIQRALVDIRRPGIKGDEAGEFNDVMR